MDTVLSGMDTVRYENALNKILLGWHFKLCTFLVHNEWWSSRGTGTRCHRSVQLTSQSDSPVMIHDEYVWNPWMSHGG